MASQLYESFSWSERLWEESLCNDLKCQLFKHAAVCWQEGWTHLETVSMTLFSLSVVTSASAVTSSIFYFRLRLITFSPSLSLCSVFLLWLLYFPSSPPEHWVATIWNSGVIGDVLQAFVHVTSLEGSIWRHDRSRLSLSGTCYDWPSWGAAVRSSAGAPIGPHRLAAGKLRTSSCLTTDIPDVMKTPTIPIPIMN